MLRPPYLHTVVDYVSSEPAKTKRQLRKTTLGSVILSTALSLSCFIGIISLSSLVRVI